MNPLIKRLGASILRTLFCLTLSLFALWLYLAQPTTRTNQHSKHNINTQRLQTIVKKCSIDFHPRSYSNRQNLNDTAQYIADHFKKAGGKPTFQSFTAWGQNYKNVRVTLGKPSAKRIIIGAHYDSHENTPGADDNASGIAGLIELAYLLANDKDIGQIELVAYALEEPPFFASNMMGSYIHATSIKKQDIAGVIILEMIGYFSDDLGSQDAPLPLLKLFYPQRGNFISVVGNLQQRAFTKQIKIGMKSATTLPVYSINGPRTIPGINFSDHRNYWDQGLNAVMITDTAFYRNTAYHHNNDTWDRLDYNRMGKVILAVHSAITHMTQKKPLKKRK